MVTGATPEPRGGHSAAIVGTGDSQTMVVWGGRGGGLNYDTFGDIHFTKVKSPSWAKSRGTGKLPIPRAHHSAVAFHGKVVIKCH